MNDSINQSINCFTFFVSIRSKAAYIHHIQKQRSTLRDMIGRLAFGRNLVCRKALMPTVKCSPFQLINQQIINRSINTLIPQSINQLLNISIDKLFLSCTSSQNQFLEELTLLFRHVLLGFFVSSKAAAAGGPRFLGFPT